MRISTQPTESTAGFEIELENKSFWINRVGLELVFFNNDVNKMISKVYDSAGIGRSVDVPEANINGIEFSTFFNLFNYFSISGNATFQNTNAKNKILAKNDKLIAGQFSETYLGKVEAAFKGFKLYLEFLAAKGMFYDSTNLLPSKNKYELNGGVSLSYKSFLINLVTKNILDNHYEDFRGQQLPGQSWSISIKYNF